MVRICVVLRTQKGQEEQTQQLGGLVAWGWGCMVDSFTAYSVGQGNFKQKDPHLARRSR